MNPIGGELPVRAFSENIFFTDSGRSSLKLFIRSGNQNKRFLIPNFLCEVIENILIEEKVDYAFYNLLEDLTVDSKTVLNKEFDVFYSINYFGQLNKIKHLNIDNKIIIEDNVFFYNFENMNNFKYWFAFNSFRKVTSFADGSLVKTNLDIDDTQIKQRAASFVYSKYQAKFLKYNYLNNLVGDEKDYIQLFEEGEKLLNEQKDILHMSNFSIFQMMNYNQENEQLISKVHYELLHKEFSKYCLNQAVNFYSYFVMKLPKRDLLRKYLFSKNIFLPIHWPKSINDNCLYNEIISIPLFSQYTTYDINYVVNSIKEFYEKY